jgi:hypothetical protein
MADRVVPIIDVPDVGATVEWYRNIGFTVIDTYSDGGEGRFAFLSFGSGAVIFSEGGRPSTRHRLAVDLYVYTHKVNDLYERLKSRAEVVEGLHHDSFYGIREFTIRDLNGLWITFGQPDVFDVLMTGEGKGDMQQAEEGVQSEGEAPFLLFLPTTST